MKVIIADLFSQDGIAQLQAAGVEVIYDHQLQGDALMNALVESGAAALVVRSTKVTAEVMAPAGCLELVIRAGAGVDNIDSNFASSRGIYVTNCPGKNAIAVAEMVFALMCGADRSLYQSTADLKNGKWNKGAYGNGKGLYGRTLGSVGSGFVGGAVIKRAQAFGMNVICVSLDLTYEEAEELGIKKTENLIELAEASDFITLHVPFNPSTEKMINADFLSHCKDDVVIVNTARGQVVDDEALIAAMDAKPKMKYAADVWAGELAAKEGDFVSALAQHKQAVGTHHCGASNKQAEDAIGQEAVRTLLMFNDSGAIPVANCVNMSKKTTANFVLNARIIENPGCIADIAADMKTRGFAIQEMENTVLLGAKATRLMIKFATENAAAVEEFKTAFGSNESIVGLSVLPVA
jgi:D-3-phosphoglycerate dehydrogenase